MEIKGFDVSGWQHAFPDNPAIDWEAAYGEGYKFVYIKATEGVRYQNGWFKRDFEGAKSAGLLVGAYHFARPEPGQAKVEADYALAFTDTFDLDLGVALDLEVLGAIPWVHELQPYAAEFLARISDHHEDAPLYTGRALLQEMGGPVPNHKLWLALGSNDQSLVPPGVHPWMLQLSTGPVAGVRGDVDQDVVMSPRGLNPPKDYHPHGETAAEEVAEEKAEGETEPSQTATTSS